MSRSMRAWVSMGVDFYNLPYHGFEGGETDMPHCKLNTLLGVLIPAAVLICPAGAFGQQVSPVVLWRGQVADPDLQKAKPSTGVIASQEELAKLWKAWRPDQDAPKVDFDGYRVVVDASDKIPLSWHGYFRREGEVRGMIGIDRGKKVVGLCYLIGVFPREVVEAAQKKPAKDGK